MELGVKEEQVYESIQKLDSIHKPHYSPMSSDFHFSLELHKAEDAQATFQSLNILSRNNRHTDGKNGLKTCGTKEISELI